MEKVGYRFSGAPGNVHEGAHPFGAALRLTLTFDERS